MRVLAEGLGVEPSHRFDPVYGLAIRCITVLPALQRDARTRGPRFETRKALYTPAPRDVNGGAAILKGNRVKGCEPPRVCRRLVSLGHAAMAAFPLWA